MNFILKLTYSLFLGWWRRCFGSDGWNIPVLKYRIIQHIIGFIACVGILAYNGLNILLACLAAGVLQGLYWARSHGCCYDFGFGKVDVSRYEQLWYWKYVKKILPESAWGGFWCDYLMMTIRYTLPAILFAICALQPACALMGLALTSIYALCWGAYDLGFTDRPTDIAEWIAGITTGIFIAFC